jgi:hypothetical protein
MIVKFFEIHSLFIGIVCIVYFVVIAVSKIVEYWK